MILSFPPWLLCPEASPGFHSPRLTCEHHGSSSTGQILYHNAPRAGASCVDQDCVRCSKILLPDQVVLTWWGAPSMQSQHRPNAWSVCKVIMSSPLQPPLPFLVELSSQSSETWLRNWHRKSLNGYQTFRGATCTLWGLNMCLEETTSAITTWPLQRPSLLYNPPRHRRETRRG